MVLEEQKEHLNSRVWRDMPENPYCCFLPDVERRGESVNWYDMSMDERHALMRNHGHLGRTDIDRVTQVISGSTGLDDWEWGVDLFANDPLVFKKLVYDTVDPANARFAEFGAFYIGKRIDLSAWAG